MCAGERGTISCHLNHPKHLKHLRCNNAKKGPNAAFNAYKEFIIKDTESLFLAAAMTHFQLKDVDGIVYV